MMKKFILVCILVFVIVTGFGIYYLDYMVNENYTEWTESGEVIRMNAYADEEHIYLVDEDGKEAVYFMKGVNIGLGEPGAFPGDIKIEMEEYLEWFRQIDEMGADTIRVYTLQSPGFYDALLQYNAYAGPLYLVQGAYMNEDILAKEQDVFHPDVLEDFQEEIINVVNATHGNAEIKERNGHAYGSYTSDVSRYVTMFLLGIEFDGELIVETNKAHEEKKSFLGEYLYVKRGSPFEVFLAQMGDYAIGYEEEWYQKQTIISFSNWPTSDPLEHPNEPEEKNNMIGFDQNMIGVREKYKAGLVASYHVYPYYPDFLNFEDQGEYLQTASTNPYQDYLKRLVDHHDVPVIVGEFGVPTSRGKTHEDLSRGYNQGGLTEEEQGNMIVSMYEDIQEAQMQGAFIFSWQDEWFKRTWNTMETTNPTGRALWHDVQTSETSFGILSFQLNQEQVAEVSLFEESQHVVVSYDAEYLWLEIKKEEGAEDIKEVYFDITPNSGFGSLDDQKLDADYDFLLSFEEGGGVLRVDPYYHTFHFLFQQQLDLEPAKKSSLLKKEELQVLCLRLRNRIALDEGLRIVEPSYYETGRLQEGTLNLGDDVYSVMHDYYVEGNITRIRIPWGMLNFSDPSKGLVLDDFYEVGYGYEAGEFLGDIPIEEIRIGFEQQNQIESIAVEAPSWEEVAYEGRLKKSYDIIKEVWAND